MQPQQDAFQDPRAVGEPGPTMSELAGRTIAVVVRSYDPTATYLAPGDKEAKSRPCVVGDLYVFDGGPLNYGGSDSTNDPKPPTHTVAVPAKFEGRYFAQVNVVSALRDAAPVILDAQGGQSRGPGQGGPVIGLVERSTFGGKPWNLTKLNAQDPQRGGQFAALRMAAGQLWGQAQAGALTWRTHADAVAIPNQAAAQAAPYGNWPAGATSGPYSPAQYGPDQAAFLNAQHALTAPGAVNPQNPQQQAWGQGTPAVDPQYAAFLAAQQAAAQSAPPAPPVDPAFTAWQAQQAQAAASVPAAPAGVIPTQAAAPAVEQDPAAPGYEAIWSTLPAPAKAAIWAQVHASNAAAQQARPNPY